MNEPERTTPAVERNSRCNANQHFEVRNSSRQFLRRRHECIDVAIDFLLSTPGKESEHGHAGGDGQHLSRFYLRGHVLSAIEQRGPDESGVYSVTAQQRVLEREGDPGFCFKLRQLWDPFCAPSPHLRRTV